MIRVYGGTVTEGLTDGVEVGTAENPILFDGLYPAPNGEAIKELTFAVRTDGEVVEDVCVIVAMLDQDGKDLDAKSEILIFSYSENIGMYVTQLVKKGKIVALNSQTLLFREINAVNQIFTIRAKAKGTENISAIPDLRGKLHIIPTSKVLIKLN